MSISTNKKLALIPLLILCLFYVYRASDFAAHDFANYYFGGMFLADGNFDTQIYFPEHFNKAIARLGYDNIFTSFAPNTPFLALVFVPLALLPLSAAKIIFNLIGIGLFFFSLIRLMQRYNFPLIIILLLPAIFLTPVKNTILFGQVYFVMFFLLAEFWLAYEKSEDKKAAICLSAAILLKVFPLLIVLLPLFQRRFRFLAWLSLSLLIMLSLTIAVTGADVWIFLIEVVLPKASAGEISGEFVTGYQSVLMFLKELFIYHRVENPDPIFDSPILYSTLLLMVKVFVIAIGFMAVRKAANKYMWFGFWVFATILISPYGSTYSFILLIFPLIGIITSDINQWKKIAAILLIFMTCNFPIGAISEDLFPLSFLRLIFLLFLFVFILDMLKEIRYKYVILAFGISILGIYLPIRERGQDPGYLLPKDSPILIYDFELSASGLNYKYWTTDGPKNGYQKLPYQKQMGAVCDRNRIFYQGIEIASGTGNKKNPIVIDDKLMIFLSDENRGIGFYTLRSVDIRK